MSRRVVAILTDFGTRDTYVGEMKAVLLRYAPEAAIVDITHEVEPFNVLEGAFLLYLAHRHFPPGTIFLAVVDPGVGTSRKGIVFKTRNYWFVCPDNGVAYPAAEHDGIEEVYFINDSSYPRVGGETFHGRDVFAHVAGELASNKDPSTIKCRIEDIKRLSISEPEVRGDEGFLARVLHIDKFGNVVLNVDSHRWNSFIDKNRPTYVLVKVGLRAFKARAVKAYGEAKEGELAALIGGTGFLELAVNKGSAARELGMGTGCEVEVGLSSDL